MGSPVSMQHILYLIYVMKRMTKKAVGKDPEPSRGTTQRAIHRESEERERGKEKERGNEMRAIIQR